MKRKDEYEDMEEHPTPKVKGRVFRKTKGASYVALWMADTAWNVVPRLFSTEVEAIQVVRGFQDKYGKEPEIAIVEFKL